MHACVGSHAMADRKKILAVVVQEVELQELRKTIEALRKQSHESPHYMEALRSPLARQLLAGTETPNIHGKYCNHNSYNSNIN